MATIEENGPEDIQKENDDVDYDSSDMEDEQLREFIEQEEEDAAACLYVNAVEFVTPVGKPVAIPVKQIVKVMQSNRNPTKEGGFNFYMIYTMDGHHTTVKTTYNWRDFLDHVFDPHALKKRLGPKFGRKDDLLDGGE